MRFFALVPVLAALTTAVAGLSLARDDTCSQSEIGCNPPHAKRDFPDQPVARSVDGLSNAELLRRGLPLRAPVMRRGTPVRRNSPSGSPPAPKATHTGVIKAFNVDGTFFGYVTKHYGGSGNFGWIPSSTDPSDALTVSFVTTDPSGSGTQLDLLNVNQDDFVGEHYSRLGFVQGRDNTDDNLSPGSYNSIYLTGTESTPPGSRPVSNVPNAFFYVPGRDTESAVWTYTPSSGALAPQWVNSDGTLPDVKTFMWHNFFIASADPVAYQVQHPDALVILVTLQFVPT